MAEETKAKIEEKVETQNAEGADATLPVTEPKTNRKFVNKKFEKGGRRNSKSFGKTKSDFEQKIINLRRVTRVVSGGRRFSFSVAIVLGDKNGSVGLGLGKATDTSIAIEKAVRDAKKKMIKPNLTETKSIPFDVSKKYGASVVMMSPSPGKGLKAGGAMRIVLDLLGAKDITGKILSRSKNHLNNAKATIESLKKIGYKKVQNKVSSDKFGPKHKKSFIRRDRVATK